MARVIKKPRVAKPREKMLQKHKTFVDTYLSNGLNAVRAWMTVNPNSDYGTARSYAAQVLANLSIREYTSEQLEKRAMSKQEALERLSAQARGDMDDFVNEDGSLDLEKARALQVTGVVKKLEINERVIVGEDGKDAVLQRQTKVELHSSQRALEIILKAHGALVDRTEVSGKDGAPLHIQMTSKVVGVLKPEREP